MSGTHEKGSESSDAAAADKAAASQMAAMGLFSPAGVAGGPAGPAWARGEAETPQGAIRTGNGYAVAVYTPEQQARTAGEPAHANNAPGVAAAVAGPTAAPRRQRLLVPRPWAAVRAWARCQRRERGRR